MQTYKIEFVTERRVYQECHYFVEVEAESNLDAIALARDWEGEIMDFEVTDESVISEDWVDYESIEIKTGSNTGTLDPIEE